MISDETKLCILSSCSTIWFIGAILWFSNGFIVTKHIICGCVSVLAGVWYLIRTIKCKNKITMEKRDINKDKN